MHRSGFKAGDRLASRRLRLCGASGRGLSAVAGAPFAGGRPGTTRRRPPLAARSCGPALCAAERPPLASSLRARPPFGPAVGAWGRTALCAAGRSDPKFRFCTRPPFGSAIGAWGRTTVSAARGPARGGSVGTRSPFRSLLGARFCTAYSRLGPPGIWALCSSRRPAIARTASIAATRRVEEITTVAAATFGKKDCRDRRNRLGGTEQLDAPLRRHLLLGGQDPENSDPIDLDFCLDTQDVSDLRVVGEDLRVDDALRLASPGSAPGVAAVTTDAGQFDVKTVRHAAVKLQAAAEFAKWDSPKARERSCATLCPPTRYNLKCGTRRRHRAVPR